MLILVLSISFLGFVSKKGGGAGTIYIRSDGSIEGSDKIQQDGNMYTFTGNINDSIVVEKDEIVIDGNGYTLQGAGNGSGIQLSNRTEVTIRNVEVRGFFWGINLSNTTNCVIQQNYITENNGSGILLSTGSSENTIEGNEIHDNGRGTGLLIGDGVSLENSNNNLVSGNMLTDNLVSGVSLYRSNSNIVRNNLIVRLDWYSEGVLVLESEGNSISNNTIFTQGHGVWVYESNENTVEKNQISRNDIGIRVEYSSTNLIKENNITKNGYGIWIMESFDEHYTTNNTVVGNTIAENQIGIEINSDGNIIYHNNFVENTNQAFFITPEFVFPNKWDNGFEGNYWSDYNGSDNNQDGIGDTPYTIDANNTDHYPLMGMFSDYEAISEYNVQTICNSSISEFQYNGTAISFNVTGENGSAGFCRVCIPTALMSEYRIFVNKTEVSYDLLPVSNSTHSYLYFTYDHSTREVVIIPEFPSLHILPLFMIATLLAALGCRKKASICSKT